MGKKTKKPGKGKEKTERKTVKAEEKKARRETKKLSPEDDIDAILLSIQKEEAKKKEVHVDDNVPAPSPRSNCSLTVNPLKETELILYGGEFYNGNKTFVYGDLFRYDVEKLEWKLVSSPNSPPPRSAHQAVAWKNYIYIFGGEFTSPNQERFHHYKDFWMLDLKTNQWEQLNLKGCPSPRSGHRMILYKHKIILFGGFYDTLREVRYYNDLFVFDLDQFKWQEIKPKPGAMWPTARSGFQLFVYQDDIFLYGGYSKEVSSDKNNSEKGIVHSDMWSLDPKTWEWNKVKKSGMPPGPRAGFSMCVHKRRALLFGGVVDIEVEGDVMMSLFLNEFYGFQLDTNRWYPLELRKEKSTKDKLKKSEQNCPDDVNKKINPACTTREETVESEDEESNIDDISKNIASNMSIVDSENLTNSDGKPKESGAKLDIQSSLPEVVKPCGRINACMAVGRDTLYIYGGMMEIKDQEITLDDLYSLNLSKLDEWKCIIPASESEWVEASEDDEEDEDGDEDESDGETSTNEDDDEEEEEEEFERPGFAPYATLRSPEIPALKIFKGLHLPLPKGFNSLNIFLYGGYSKEVSSDKNNSEKGIVHSDMWSLDPKTWEWNKVKKSGMPPGPRAGFSMCVHKRRALLFGGVVDIEVEGDVMMSLFLNEFYGFQLDTNRWYPLELRKEKSTKDKLKKSEQNCPDDVNKKINPACTTREETVESEDEESNIDDISKNIASNMSIVDSENLTNSDGKPKESGAKLDIQSSLPEVVKPCGRINACMAVGRDTLYIYGGMMEIKDQEITLDDLYSLNLSKLDEWKCIIPASESEWVEASEDDEEDEDGDEDESDGETSTNEDDDEEEEEEEAQNASVEVGDAVALIKGVGKNLRRKERRSRIEQIRASLGLSDSQRTPMPGESLRDFYRRTNMYWQMAAHEHTQHTGKVSFLFSLEFYYSFITCIIILNKQRK
ncbi:kelch domain-containing protein 4 [Vigna umbellata]|uniref:kelch domain-containing protein 4 n=1 Tax=Vigna umbellata TaxID=87088 RepID=UPI001F5E4914|nr:kelch domain-containing protein 4 [Vigna umbellata]